MRHKLTEEEGRKGAQNSISSRRYIAKVQKQLARLGIEKEVLGKVLDVLKIFVSTPAGQVILGIVAVNLLYKAGLFDGADKDHVGTAIIAAIGLGALSSSGLISQVGSLIGTLGHPQA